MKLLKKVVRAIKKGALKEDPIITEENHVDPDLEHALNQSALEATLRESETAGIQLQLYDIRTQIPENAERKPRRRKSSDEKKLVDEEESYFLQAIEESLVVNYAVQGPSLHY